MCWLWNCFKPRKPEQPLLVDYEDLFNDTREPLVFEPDDYHYNLVFEPWDENDPNILL